MDSFGLSVPPLVLGNSHLYCTLSSNKLKYFVDSLGFYTHWVLQRLYMNEKKITVFISSAHIYIYIYILHFPLELHFANISSKIKLLSFTVAPEEH